MTTTRSPRVKRSFRRRSARRSPPRGRSRYYLDVTHPTANKGTVIERLARYLKIPLEAIATIGDQPTDVLMFKRSGLSIAMGNASEDVQRQATHVTTSHDDEGFANAVDQFILPRAKPAGTDVLKATGQLHRLGQSLWLDNITRDLLSSGTLQHYIDDLSVTGLTSNPTIFEQAIKNSSAYDSGDRRQARDRASRVKRCSSSSRSRTSHAPPICFDRSTIGPTAWTAGCRSRSRRCSPTTPPATIAAAKSLFASAGRPNLMIKIPGTAEGLPAIEEAIFAGIPINVTLLFSREHYFAAAEAFLRGIERRIDAGLKPDVASVASVFVSRWDSAVAAHRARRAAQSARHRHGQAHLQGVPIAPQLAALAAHLQRRRPAAAAPVGQHGHQGSQGV